jgi:ankyrin repeat protein
MKLLLSKGVDIESESDAGTPLVWAAGHGQEDAVKLLLQQNAKVLSIFGFFFVTPLTS